MKQVTKKLFTFAGAVGVAAALAGCSSQSKEPASEVNYVQTHQDADVAKISARMFQRAGSAAPSGKGTAMGRIWFRETNSGLQMVIDLNNVRPNVEYTFHVFDMTNCDLKAPKTGCEKIRKNVNFPTVTGDADRNLRATFMATGITAADLNGGKITLNRPDANGQEVEVGWGMLRERRLF
jgi:hypothetical protein